jgi:SAM-dependent methyltransferase
MALYENNIHGIEEFYNREAQGEKYETMYDSPVCHAEDWEAGNFIGQITRGKTLDVGSGAGLLLNIHDFDTRLDGQYHGIDLSHGLLSNAKADFPRKHFANSDMHRLPYPNGSFETLVSMYGPFSYSLDPEKLLNEFDRVTTPDARYLIMPYTQRTGHEIELGGESTAIYPHIKKIFYTGSLAKLVFNRYPTREIRGLNYFLNPLTRMIQKGETKIGKIKPELFIRLVNGWAKKMREKPPEMDKTMFVNLTEAWNCLGSTKPNLPELKNLLIEERIIARIIPPEYARHMMVMASKA